MNIEVIVNGKGSITINQKADFEPATLRKLTKQAVNLLTNVPGKSSYGFGAGTSLDSEMVCDG